MIANQMMYKIRKFHPCFFAWVVAFALVLSPLSALASTPTDSEVRSGTQWYAYRSGLETMIWARDQ